MKNMDKTYRLGEHTSKARNMYIMMQQSVAMFKTMTQRHTIYPLLFDSSLDPANLNEVYRQIRTCATLA